MFDAIVVGARCAGSPLAMLLARRGYRVAVVDRAAFPSDTISTHILWPHGAEMLDRWSLLSRLAATHVPPICRAMSFDVGPFALRGSVPDANDGRGGYCPRRTVLDALLVNAAAEAGADIREQFIVEDLVVDAGVVTGIRGRTASGAAVEERARIVIGADGVHSLVAKRVRAREYDTEPVLACGYYSYFADVEQQDIELYVRDRCAFACAPTHDGLHMLVVNWPGADFEAVRADVEGHVARAIDTAPEFAARLRAGRRADRWYGAAGVPNYFRTPYGDGWALAGDAGYCRDPITAQGISDAFADAESLARAIDDGSSGRRPIAEAMASHESTRNDRVRAMYGFTQHLAALEPPPPEMQQLFGALRGNRDATNAFFSAITGAISIGEFMSPANVARIVAAAGASSAGSTTGGSDVRHP
jgi:2-polyprenyl-6-methoxyphenol hydroxylase-like FAD-dependent oxidoreductase